VLRSAGGGSEGGGSSAPAASTWGLSGAWGTRGLVAAAGAAPLGDNELQAQAWLPGVVDALLKQTVAVAEHLMRLDAAAGA
jgi:hypothetical protein